MKDYDVILRSGLHKDIRIRETKRCKRLRGEFMAEKETRSTTTYHIEYKFKDDSGAEWSTDLTANSVRELLANPWTKSLNHNLYEFRIIRKTVETTVLGTITTAGDIRI